MTKFKIRKSREIYQSRIIRLCDDEIEFADGRKFRREILHHPGAVAIVPVLEKGKIILIKQFRYAAGDFLWEIPAGTLEKGETIRQCAHRELKEEIGYSARRLKRMVNFYPTPGVSSEIIYIFKASGLIKAEPHREEDELLKQKKFSFKEAIELIKKGKIIDAKTIIGLLLLKSSVLEQYLL